MTAPNNPVSLGSAADQILAALVADFANRLQAGEPVDVSAYAREHPEHAEELCRLLPDVQVLAELGRSAGAGASAGVPLEDSSGPPFGALGDFRLLREVGRGGMGVVYEAEQLSLRRRVALKVLPFAAALDPKQLQRFKQEAEAAAHLHHTNIVAVHFVGCERGVHFYAMQFIDGQTLAAVIRELRGLAGLEGASQDGSTGPAQEVDHGCGAPAERGQGEGQPLAAPSSRAPVPGATTLPAAVLATEQSARSPAHFRTVARLGVQAAEALGHAHQLGIVHRDIKPANLLVDGRGHLWVTDFGLAHFQSEAGLTLTGDLLGTLRYMSPEQALAQRSLVDHRTDIYSLGATLYELLTLRPVCDGQDRQEVLRQIEREEPRRPRRLNPAVPADLETIVLKALAKEPEGRYATSQELANDLRRFLEDKPIRAKRPTLLQRARKWGRRHKPVVVSLAGAAAVLLVAVAVTATVAALRITREQQRTQRVAAEFAFDKADLLGKQGDANLALLWMARSLKMAPAEAGDLQAVIRTNLAAWRSRVNPLLMVLPQKSRVDAVAFTPDGRTLLTAAGRHTQTLTVRRWDAADGQGDPPVSHRRGSLVTAVTFSPDGETLLIGYQDGVVQLVSVATGQPRWESPALEGRITTAAFSPDGRMLLIGWASSRPAGPAQSGWAQLREIATGRVVGPALEHPRQVHAAAFSPDGKTFVTMCGIWLDGREKGLARFWDLEGKKLRELPHPSMATAVVFSPDGQQLLTADGDFTARLWDVATGQVVRALPHEGPVRAVAFSRDGRALLTGSFDRTARLWNRATGQPLSPPLWHQRLVHAVAFSPDGKSFLSASEDSTARLWEVASPSHAAPPWPHHERFFPLAFSPDRRTLLTQDADQTVRLRDGRTAGPVGVGEPLRPGVLVLAGAFRSDRKTAVLVGEDSSTWLWNLETGERLTELKPPQQNPQIFAVAFSPDGKCVLTGTWNRAWLWDDATGKPPRELAHQSEGPVFAIAFSPDGKYALTGGADGTARLWDVATGEQIGEPLTHYTTVFAVAFSGDGKTILTGGGDHSARLWDVATRKPLGPPLAHHSAVLAVAFSPDGRIVLTGSRDQTARLWDVATGKPLGPPYLHPGPIHRVAFWLDGKTVLTANAGWDPRLLTGEEMVTRFWHVPAPLSGDADQLELWAQVVTGMELEANGGVRPLDAATWQERREKLKALGFQGP